MMRKNLHRGTVHTEVPGVGAVELRFTWGAISDLRGLYGAEWEAKVDRILSELDTKGLAQVLELISPYQADWWMEKSPPFVPTGQAVFQAMRVGFFGADDSEAKGVPQTALQRLMTRFWRAGNHGSSSEATPSSSGA